MIEKLIENTIKDRNAAHAEHWTTKSGYHHEVLGEFYEEVISKLDSIVEARIPVFGVPKNLPDQTDELLKQLQDQAIWIAKNRSEIAGNITAIENIVDDLSKLYLNTIFKLEQLR